MRVINFKIFNKQLLTLFLVLNLIVLPIKGYAKKGKLFAQNNIYITYDKNNKPNYKRYNPNTGEYNDISIFDDENIGSFQYGANQNDLKNHAEELIKNPFILKELKKYYPDEFFETTDEAEFFYKKYLEIISDNGCGYAAACNYVFKMFEGHEKEFEKTFGYPMYTVDENGNIDFNYEIFIVKFFNYSVLENQYSNIDILNSVMKDIFKFRLDKYINSNEYKINLPKDFEKMSAKEFEKWNKKKEKINAKFHDLYTKWNNSSNTYINFGVTLDETFGNLGSYLKKFNIIIESELNESATQYNVGDILASEEFTLMKVNSSDKPKKQFSSHYVYITNIEDGKIYVSSWGKKYIFDNPDAEWTSSVSISSGK